MSFKEQLLQLDRNGAMNMTEQQIEDKVESTIARTFGWMGLTLLVAFGIAYGSSLGYSPIPFTSTGMRISWIAGLGIIFGMSRKRQSMSKSVMVGLLMLFAVLEGYGLTGVFYSYSLGSIYNIFLSSSVMFLVLALIGHRVKINVAARGPLLVGGIIALIVALLLNSFVLQSTQFDIRLSIIGIVLFGAFIIYDMNVLKQQALVGDDRIEVLMALGLFINFINIFLFLLRLFGGRD